MKKLLTLLLILSITYLFAAPAWAVPLSTYEDFEDCNGTTYLENCTDFYEQACLPTGREEALTSSQEVTARDGSWSMKVDSRFDWDNNGVEDCDRARAELFANDQYLDLPEYGESRWIAFSH